MNRLPSEIDGPGLLQRRSIVHVDGLDEATGLLQGRAVPYGVATELMENVFERFESGAFAAQVRAKDQHARVKLLYSHDSQSLPLGRAVDLAETEDGLHAEFQINMRLVNEPGSFARQAYLSILEGDLSDLSIGFVSKSARIERDGDKHTIVRKRAHLAEVSVVPYGAYGKAAQLTSVRSDETWRDGWTAKIAALRSN